MLRFKEFLSEDAGVYVDVKPDNARLNMDKANDSLDDVTLDPFVNSAVFINAVRATLERFGIVLPAHSQMHQLTLEGEISYELGESGLYIYMVWNQDPEGNVEGYAQIVNKEDLDDLQALNGEPEEVKNEDPTPPSMRYPKARRDDDSGNTNEYP